MDLYCWMALASGVMAKIADLLRSMSPLRQRLLMDSSSPSSLPSFTPSFLLPSSPPPILLPPPSLPPSSPSNPPPSSLLPPSLPPLPPPSPSQRTPRATGPPIAPSQTLILSTPSTGTSRGRSSLTTSLPHLLHLSVSPSPLPSTPLPLSLLLPLSQTYSDYGLHTSAVKLVRVTPPSPHQPCQ